MKRALSIAAILAVVGISSTACLDKATQPWQDAPRSGVKNTDPADIIEMPDGFNNLATKCDHGNRLYVSYHGDKAYGFVATVPQDPTCPR